MTWKHDLALWIGKVLYRLHLIDYNTYFNEVERIVCGKYNYKREVVELE